MMRDIRFRGKRADTGKWVEGYYVCEDAIHAIMTVEKDGNSRLLWNEVDPETVGQGTGLKDKDGVKIFEGDVVHYVYQPGEGFWNGDFRAIIEFASTGFRLTPLKGQGGISGWLVSIPGLCASNKPNALLTVTGSIHDTPELLEESNGN